MTGNVKIEQWVERQDVPIIDAHVLFDRESGKTITVDRDRLEKIARKLNFKVETTGDEVPVVIGHTKDGEPGEVPEWEQPPIVGYAQDFYVQDHETLGRPFLYAKRYKLYEKSKVGPEELTADEVMKRFPRRSAEVWLSSNDIDPISLLGATTPMRNLGLVRNRRAGKVSKYEKGDDTNEAVGADYQPEMPKKLQKGGSMDTSAVIMALEALIGQLKSGMTPEGEAAVSAVDEGLEAAKYAEGGPEEALGDAGPDGFTGQYGGDIEEETSEAQEPGEDGEEKEKFEKKEGVMCADPKLETVKMQRDQKALEARVVEKRLAAIEAENKRLRDEARSEKLKYQRKVRESDLKQLVAEGYSLVVEEEIDELAGLSEETYEKRLGQIRKRYSRVPLNEDFIQTATIREGGPKTPTKELCARAGAIAARSGQDYATVLRQLQNGEI